MAINPNLSTAAGSDSPMLVLVSSILFMGSIGAFIAWGLTHAYPIA